MRAPLVRFAGRSHRHRGQPALTLASTDDDRDASPGSCDRFRPTGIGLPSPVRGGCSCVKGQLYLPMIPPSRLLLADKWDHAAVTFWAAPPSLSSRWRTAGVDDGCNREGRTALHQVSARAHLAEGASIPPLCRVQGWPDSPALGPIRCDCRDRALGRWQNSCRRGLAGQLVRLNGRLMGR